MAHNRSAVNTPDVSRISTPNPSGDALSGLRPLSTASPPRNQVPGSCLKS
jgi:hypothetical protein